MTTDTPESLQEIARLVDEYAHAAWRAANYGGDQKQRSASSAKAALLSAITRVVQDRDKMEKALRGIPCSCCFVSEKADRSDATSVVCARCAALSTAEGKCSNCGARMPFDLDAATAHRCKP